MSKIYNGNNKNNGYHNKPGLDEFRGKGGNDLAIWYGNNGDDFIFRGGKGRDTLLIDDLDINNAPDVTTHGKWTWLEFNDGSVIKMTGVEQLVIRFDDGGVPPRGFDGHDFEINVKHLNDHFDFNF